MIKIPAPLMYSLMDTRRCIIWCGTLLVAWLELLFSTYARWLRCDAVNCYSQVLCEKIRDVIQVCVVISNIFFFTQYHYDWCNAMNDGHPSFGSRTILSHPIERVRQDWGTPMYMISRHGAAEMMAKYRLPNGKWNFKVYRFRKYVRTT